MLPEVISTVAIIISAYALNATSRQAKAAEASSESAQSQAKSAAIDAKLPTLMELLREYRSKEFTRTRNYIRKSLQIDYPPSDKGFDQIPEDPLLSILALLHFLDNLGLFVRTRLVDTHLVSIFMGRAIEDSWDVLLPYIKVQRVRSPDYAENLQFLVAKCNANTQSESRRTL